MSKLPRVSGRECVRALAKVGFSLRRQEGSHMILRRDDPFAQVVVPDHRELETSSPTTVVIDVHTLGVYREFIMKGTHTTMHRRINITLPEATVRLIDRVAAKGDRSRLIDEAVRHYVQRTGRAALRKQLREGAQRRAERDLVLARDWFPLEEEAWRPRAK